MTQRSPSRIPNNVTVIARCAFFRLFNETIQFRRVLHIGRSWEKSMWQPIRSRDVVVCVTIRRRQM